MNIKLGYGMLIFWYANSIWELESESFSSREKRDHSGGKQALLFKAHFSLSVSPGRFLCLQGVMECSLDSKETPCWFPRALTGTQCLTISLVLMVL